MIESEFKYLLTLEPVVYKINYTSRCIMSKLLKIDYYMNGYSANQFNCIDIPIAGASGYYNYDNYFYYLFNYFISTNWPDNESDYFKLEVEILKKMGLAIKPIYISNSFNLIEMIKSKIDNDIPVLLPVKYKYLFYSIGYGTQHGSHFIIINGYDAQRAAIQIRDTVHIQASGLNELIKDTGLYFLQLTDNLISDIWESSNTSFREENSCFYNTLYTIEKIGEPQIDSYNYLIEDFVNSCNIKNSSLINIVDNFHPQIDKFSNNSFIEGLRRTYHGAAVIMFDVIDRVFQISKLSAEKQDMIFDFKESYLKFRYLLISKLHAQALRERPIDDYKKSSIKQEILLMDSKLILLIKNLKSLLYSQENDKYRVNVKLGTQQVNYALKAKATADSEKSPNANINYKASQAIDGDTGTMWISNNSGATHWIKVDLGEPRTINKFVIKHFGDHRINTRCFKIQGCNKAGKWVSLVTVNSNIKDETIHEILPVAYRYFRLYITYPTTTDYMARISEFEIWGNCE